MRFNRIGFYFGSFNPMHVGHLFVIREALKTAIDKLYVIVSPQSPFKDIMELAPFTDRFNMAKLTIEENKLSDRVEVVDWEKDRFPSYTIDTLEYAKNLLGKDKEYTIFMGLDNFISIDTWKGSNVIIGDYGIYVIPRDDPESARIIDEKAEQLREWHNGNVKSITHGNPYNMISISATDIRKYLSNNEELPIGLISKAAENYIKEKRLYYGKDN